MDKFFKLLQLICRHKNVFKAENIFKKGNIQENERTSQNF